MDGYAVRAPRSPHEGVALPVSQRIPAGSAAQPLAPGSAARIFTGASVPEGADAIVMQEDTRAGRRAARARPARARALANGSAAAARTSRAAPWC